MANIKIQLNQFLMELSGSEEFVRSQYNELVEKCHLYEWVNEGSDKVTNRRCEHRSDNMAAPNYDRSDYDGLFSLIGDNAINFNMMVPGNNKAEKIKSLVLLIGYAKKNEWVPFSMIAEECKRQGCWDSKNFASYVKQLGSNVMISGKGKNKAVRLTAIGLEAAKDKIKNILGEK